MLIYPTQMHPSRALSCIEVLLFLQQVKSDDKRTFPRNSLVLIICFTQKVSHVCNEPLSSLNIYFSSICDLVHIQQQLFTSVIKQFCGISRVETNLA